VPRADGSVSAGHPQRGATHRGCGRQPPSGGMGAERDAGLPRPRIEKAKEWDLRDSAIRVPLGIPKERGSPIYRTSRDPAHPDEEYDYQLQVAVAGVTAARCPDRAWWGWPVRTTMKGRRQMFAASQMIRT